MNRIQSVDVFRVLAIFAVIVIHTKPFAVPPIHLAFGLDVENVINQAARFAVPFFFVTSGYFWASKFTKASEVFAPSLKMGKRLLFIFLAWSVVYLLPLNFTWIIQYGPLAPFKAVYWTLVSITDDPVGALFQGSKAHLWFLNGLMICLAISATMLMRHWTKSLIVLAVVLYVIGLLGDAYADAPLGFHTHFNFRKGPFFGLIFFVSGFLLQRRGANASWMPLGLMLTVLGFALHFFEIILIHRLWGTSMEHDYVIGTYFLGVGVAMMALSNVNALRFPRLSLVGPFVLGIYAIHYLFVDLLAPIAGLLPRSWAVELAYPVVVFILSYYATSALAKYRFTRPMVA